MVLSSQNKKVLVELGILIKANAEAWGADALARLFELHPQTKRYFSKFSGFDASDEQVRKHGQRVMNALAEATRNVDNLHVHLEDLARKHGEVICVDPQNFHLFAVCILVTLATHLQAFPLATHCAVHKFLQLITDELSTYYR
ncbi:hemoglobin subunit alpha-like [Hypanus sabinus]|uniref:hemoglobin subunit alpha-like n=1 Tax=Hypanus sabinus TaxID=79690 RepID=UPI0028C40C1C|nr:hemoglobin subunit alpha-like [Hypanus sabinus]